MSSEISRRCVRIRLDAHLDRPEKRTVFKHQPLAQFVASHREELVAAVLTVISAWLAAGRPKGSKVLGSFESWSETMGGILEVVGLGGFLESDPFADLGDVERDAWQHFVLLWDHHYGDREVGVSELWKLLGEPDSPDLGLGQGNERSQQSKLGLRLKRRRDTIYGCLKITAARKYQGALMWRLVRASEAPSAHMVPPVDVVPPGAAPPVDMAPASTPVGGNDRSPSSPGSQRATGGTGSIPFFITKGVSARLLELGVPEAVINQLRPDEALEYIKNHEGLSLRTYLTSVERKR
jgi:hypothetical protein